MYINLLSKFQNAFRGISFVFKHERNFRIESFVASLMVIMAVAFKITVGEWILLLSVIFFVLILEMINSAIEYLCDLINDSYHIKIQVIKDVSAGFVLLGSVFSIMIGIYLFALRIISFVTALVS